MMVWLHLHLVLLLAATNQPCYALAVSASKIISRKSDGQYKTYYVNGGKEDNDNGEGGTNNDRKEMSFLHPSAALHRVQSALRSTFLPALPSNNGQDNDGKNYQLDTLRKSGYLNYIIYDNIQDLSTSLRSVLATQRILEGVGVGRAGATALSATLSFVIRDGCGMVASLLFTSYAAKSFRRNVKRWKYFADVMVDLGITLEIIAPSVLAYPLTQHWFLPLLCLGNICKALCGVAAGACGGALQMYWANVLMGTEEGISEVAAKSGAQRTVMGGLGLIMAALVAKWLGSGSDIRIALSLYCFLTVVHLVTNYKALKLISLNWLNGWRLHLVVDEFLKCVGKTNREMMNEGSVVVSNPIEASRKEPLLFLPERRSMKIQSKYPIRMGVSFNEFSRLSYQTTSELQSLMQKEDKRKDHYFLTVGHAERHKKRCILISYFSNSTNSEKAKAYLHGCLVRRALISQLNDHRESNRSEMEKVQQAEENARRELNELYPIFERCATNSGWKLDKTECSTEGYELYLE